MLDCVNMLSNWDFPALGAPTIATSKRRFSLLVSADEDSGRIESGDRHDLVETKEKERRTRRFIVVVANEKANDENQKTICSLEAETRAFIFHAQQGHCR